MRRKDIAKAEILYQGDKYESQGGGKFVKDIVRNGLWVHPRTGQQIKFTPQRLERLARNNERFLKNGNRIPYPDGHSMSSKDNMGFWTGPFITQGGKLYGVVEPTDERAKKDMLSGSLDSVSALIEFDYQDPKGNKYDEVMVHICGTNYPVLTEQGRFVKLSQEDGTDGDHVFLPSEQLDQKKKKDEDPDTQKAVDALAQALDQASTVLVPKSKPVDAKAIGLALMEAGGVKAQALQSFPGGFEGCVAEMQRRGARDPRGLCAFIGRRAGKIR